MKIQYVSNQAITRGSAKLAMEQHHAVEDDGQKSWIVEIVSLIKQISQLTDKKICASRELVTSMQRSQWECQRKHPARVTQGD